MFRSILALLSGATVSQAITLLSTMLLSRFFYTEEAYGRFADFIASINILSALGTLRYDALILVPKTEQQADQLAATATHFLRLIGLVSFAALLLTSIMYPIPAYMMLVPFGGWLLGNFNIQNNRLAYRGQFALIARTRILMTLCAAAMQWLFYFLLPDFGLILGNTIGLLFALWLWRRKLPVLRTEADKIAQTRKDYRHYIRWMLPSGGLNILYINLQPMSMLRLFGEAIAGNFFMAQRLLFAPLQLLSNSIAQVFFREAGLLRHQSPERLHKLLLKTSGSIALVMFLPCLLVWQYGDVLVPWVLGDTWIAAGKLMQLLAILIFFQSLYSPVSAIAEVMEAVHVEFAANVYFMIQMIVAMYLGWHYQNFELSVFLLAVGSSVGYVSLLAYFLIKTRNAIF